MHRLLLLLTSLTIPVTAFEHFEARQTHPLAITPDGTRLLALNSLEGRLSVFALDGTPESLPLLVAEIPVGLEPVSVKALTNQEVWVVNELSDSVSIIDLSRARTVATIPVGDEPADLIFAQGKAFVSCAQSGEIQVIDLASREVRTTISLAGVFPRALAAKADGSRLFVAFHFSGNNSTVLHFRDAPAQPSPTNPMLPAPPRTALLVPDTDPRVSYDVLDHDVAEIDPLTGEVERYLGGLGTNILALLVTAEETLWTASSEARNLIRFEPNLNGVFAESRLSRTTAEGTQVIDLNPHALSPQITDSEKELTLAQPMALLADQDQVWMGAFGSDRIAAFSTNGEILHRVDLRSLTSPALVRGPRGLAKDTAIPRLYVLNKLSDTISIVDTETASLLAEFPLSSHDPMPAGQRRGRGLFYDSRTSGNGTVSCGVCHFDADHDGVAWDLGDPGGAMIALAGENRSLGESDPVLRSAHPMKGPMVTQSLRGIRGAAPFHWRGDKDSIHDFRTSFPNLQSAAVPSTAAMAELVSYLESVRSHPNPHRTLSDQLPPELAGGDPAQGGVHFRYLNTCSKCHEGGRGTNHLIDEFTSVLTSQPVKNSTLEHFYKKRHFTPGEATSLSGFGLTHDGTGADFPRGHEYDQDNFARLPNAERDVTAFLLATPTDTAPAVGAMLTVNPPLTDPADFRLTLESQAATGKCGVVIWGSVQGEPRSFAYDPESENYVPDSERDPAHSFADLLTLLDSAPFTIVGVPVASTGGLSIDRDQDSLLNRDSPSPVLTLRTRREPFAGILPPDWFLEYSRNLHDWSHKPNHETHSSSQFFRLRKTW